MSKVFLVKHKYEADKKVYFVDYAYEAEEKVFLVKYAYEADYKAFEVSHAYEADIKVFRVKYAYEADAFKRSSRTPKSTGIFGSSSGSSSSSYSSSDDSATTSSSFSSSSSYDSDYSSGSENSGCGKKAFIWFVTIILMGWGLQKLGILDQAVSSISDNGSNGKIINTEGLNLRRSAGTDGEIIKLMIQNDSIWPINDSSQVIGSNTWVLVTDKIDTGWVNEKFIQ